MATVRTGNLDFKDYLILLTLKQQPRLSNAKIAERVGVAPETVRLRVRALKERKILRPDRRINDPLLGERAQTEIEAAYRPSRLGLVRHHVLFSGIDTRDKLNALKQLCDVHPHTHYRVVAFGRCAALYTQFDLPPRGESTIKKLYDEVEARGLCAKYMLVDSRYVSGGGADLERWDIKRSDWDITYGRKSAIGTRLSRVEALWADFIEDCPPNMPEDEKSVGSEPFDALDLQLLRELTINSKVNYKELSQVYGKDPTTISRRVDRIREKFAPLDILYYNRSVFDLTYPQIIAGRFRPNDELNARTFHWFLQSGRMPFETKGVTNGSDFILFTMTPPSFAPELSEFFWEHAEYAEVFQLQLDSSYTYFFYYENWTPETGWRVDEEYMVNGPLSEIE